MAEPLRWLLLFHQLPAQPAYLRVKVRRQLQALGSVLLKNSLYALPASAEAGEDFQWMVRQIEAAGGEASVVEANLVEGLSDEDVKARFRAASDEAYGELAREVQGALRGPAEEGETLAIRFRRRLEEIRTLDFFGAAGRADVEDLLASLEARRLPARKPGAGLALKDLKGRTWVTRKGIHVDRIACAWLIRRFIDPGARFRFVDPKGHRIRAGELRFDMAEGEFTHEGDRCSFETFLHRLNLEAPGLRAVAELVHDVELKDQQFRRPETEGFARAIQGVALLHGRDEDRLAAGAALLDAFFAALKGTPP
ncbi:MAG TPA: chromate resistance protein ChrB domain-containing protein [Holophagaceae bacterium]|nr:chromate resistance protein ChrB domain-containing protein [Holophagaceae bacterium]HJW32857.1 chromate resistance protein ChrB domain-containing protein [Holophagaceae bacterium]